MPEEIKWIWDNVLCKDNIPDMKIEIKNGTYYLSNIPEDYESLIMSLCEVAYLKYGIQMEVM